MADSPIALVVNEEEWLARSIEAVLVDHGYDVRRAANARETFELLTTTRPDAVILDRRLPDSEGIALCQRLREDPRVGPSVPIAVTSMVSLSAGERAEFFRAGAWDLWGPLLEPEVFAIKLDTFVSAKRTPKLQSSAGAQTGLLSSQALTRRSRETGALVSRLGAPLACIAIVPSDNGPGSRSMRSVKRALLDLARDESSPWRSADLVGQLSDFELGIVAPGCDSAGAIAMYRRLRGLLDTATATRGDERAAIWAGVCASVYLSESTVNIPDMLQNAELAARYAASQEGPTDILSYDDIPPESRP